MEKSSSRCELPPKDSSFRLINEKKHTYVSTEMQNVKNYQMNAGSHQSERQEEHGNSRSNRANSGSFSLQFTHENPPDNVMSESGSPCVDTSPPLNHSRSLNSCIPIGQAFPQMLGGITEFRKNLMVTVQTEVSPRDVLQGQSMFCLPASDGTQHQPMEQLERQRQRNRQRMKNLRLDPEFRAQERLRQRQRMFLKRQDPQFREKERILQRVRVREKRNMMRALESGNGLIERLATSSTPSRTTNSISENSSNGTLVPTSGSSSGTGTSLSQSNGSLTVYGTLVDGSQLSQHLLLPNNFLVPSSHGDLHHLHHSLDHNGNPNSHDCPGLHRGCPGSFNFELCRNNMLPNCKVCMKLYQDLSKHARGHKRNHRCTTCGRVFRLKQHLKGHMKTHGDKNLACPHCPYKTCYNFALNRHLILKHSQGQQGNPHPPAVALECHRQPSPLDVPQPNQLNECSNDVIS